MEYLSETVELDESGTKVGDLNQANLEHPDLECMRGRRIGGHKIRARIGAGNMGVVYSAVDLESGEEVALKLVHPKIHPSQERRLFRESKALARIQSKHVVRLFETGLFEGRPYLAMQFIRGMNLSDWLDKKPSLRRILEVFIEAGFGLRAVHQAGMVHRDFKPDNVLIGADGHPVLADFGLTCSRGYRSTGNTPNQVSGTPAYMAPERYRGATAHPKADQFSFCVALYQAVFGIPPFDGDSCAELRENIEGGQLRVPEQLGAFQRELGRILHRGLLVDPNQRWTSMSELLGELQGLLTEYLEEKAASSEESEGSEGTTGSFQIPPMSA